MSESNFLIKATAGFYPAREDMPLLRAKDVEVTGGRLDKFIPIILTNDQYQRLYNAGAGGVEVELETGETIVYDQEQIYFIKQET